MYLVLETWGKLFSLYVNNKNTFELLTKDPFFWAQLPDFKIKFSKHSMGIVLEEKRGQLLEENAISHFPFFISSFLWNILLQESAQLLHGGAFICKKILYVILGEVWVGKSTILYKILHKKKENIQILCDDKVVLNLTWNLFVSGNQWLSMRGEIHDALNVKSKFTKKNYLQVRTTKISQIFSEIKFIKLVNAPNQNPWEISTKELILYLYHNILDLASWNQACSLSPLLTYWVEVALKDKENLLQILVKYIDSKKCSAYQCDKNDLPFILSLIS